MKYIYAIALSLMMVLPCYALDVDTMVTIIDCESAGKYNAVGDGGKSYGIVQFQKATFNEMKRQAHMPNLEYKNPIHQMRLMVWGFNHGYASRWTCFRKLTQKEIAKKELTNPLHIPDQQPLVFINRETYEQDLSSK